MKIFELIFNEEETEGVENISFVYDAANQQTFMAFAECKLMKMSNVDEEKRIVTGVVLIPEQRIKRIDQQTGEEFFVFAKAKTIEKLSYNFMLSNRLKNVNIEHSKPVDGVSLIENWIVKDGNNDKANALGFDVPSGTWMASFKVDNDELWNQIKNGEKKGFSIEAWLGLTPVEFSSQEKDIEEMTEDELKELYDEIQKIINNVK